MLTQALYKVDIPLGELWALDGSRVSA